MSENDIEKETGSQRLSCYKVYDAVLTEKSVSLDELYNYIKYGDAIYEDKPTLKEQTNRARQVLDAGDKAGYTEIKERISGVTIHACFIGRRKKTEKYTLTGLIMIDCDHIPPEQMERMLESIKKDPHVLLVCKSLSGQGIHTLFKYSPLEEQYFPFFYQATAKYAKIMFGPVHDDSCKDITRQMFVNYDPDVYYNRAAIPLDWSTEITLRQDRFNNIIQENMNIEVQLSRYLDEAESSFNLIEGHRHSSIVSLAGSLNRAGFEEESVVEELISRYEQPGFPSEEIERIVRSIYKDDELQHGINQKRNNRKKDKWTNGQLPSSTDNEEEYDEEEDLAVPCPDVEPAREYIPDGMFDAIMEPGENKEIRFASLISLITALGAMMPAVRCKIDKFDIVRTYIYSIITGAAASGKSCIKRALQIFLKHSARVEGESKAECDKRAAQHKEWEKCEKACKEGDCGCGPEPQKIEPIKIQLSTHISESKLITHLANNSHWPTLLYDTELDRAMEIKEFPLSAPLRQAYEGEAISSHTHAHGDVSVKKPKLSLLTAGTPAQLRNFLKNKEDGMTSRTLVVFLPDCPYKPIGSSSAESIHEYDQAQRALEGRVHTFSNLVTKREIFFHLGQESAQMINAYFEDASKRYVSYGSAALRSFILRLRSMDIRISQVLAVCSLYNKNELLEGLHTYELPANIVRLVLSWNDFLIGQHIKLLSQLPENSHKDEGKELKYNHVYKLLPCEFQLSEAALLYEKYAHVSKRTAQRILKSLLRAGLLVKEKQTYRKVNCQESPKAPESPESPETPDSPKSSECVECLEQPGNSEWSEQPGSYEEYRGYKNPCFA